MNTKEVVKILHELRFKGTEETEKLPTKLQMGKVYLYDSDLYACIFQGILTMRTEDRRDLGSYKFRDWDYNVLKRIIKLQIENFK